MKIGRPLGNAAGVGCLLIVAALATLFPGPAQAQYKIGAEDVLHIAVAGNKDLDMDVTVQPDGRIFFPLAGEVQAAGKTIPQLAEELTQKLQTLLRDAVVGVTVKEVNSYKLFLVGAVSRPGTFKVRSEITLLQLLSLAGGVAEGADLAQVYIVRKDTRIPVNAKRLLEEGDPTQNPVLLPDDTVVVPKAPPPPPPTAALPGGPGEAAPAGPPPAPPEPQFVYIMGEVRRPGAIPLGKDMNVVKALALAGGFTPFASPKRVVVIREEDEKKVTINVDVADLLKGGETKDIVLKPGDVIHVPESLF